MALESILERIAVALEQLAAVQSTDQQQRLGGPADPTPAAPRKPRKPIPAPAVESAAEVLAPAESAPNTALLPGAVQPAAQPQVVATPAKEPTLDDVRTALVQCQTRKGGRDVPQSILAKYSPTKVTGGVPKDKYAALIAECNAA